MTIEGQGSLAERLAGVEEIECVTPDLNGVPRGKVMTGEGFLSGRRLQLARGVLLQCIMGGYPPARFYGSDDGDLALVAEPTQVHRLPWSNTPRAFAICDAQELDGTPSGLSTRGLLKQVVARYAAHGWQPVVATELEFFVFAPNTDPNEPFQAPLGPDGRRELGYSAFSVSSNNGLRPFFEDVYRCMDALGLVRDTFMHEMGTSQFEINFLHGDPVLLADQTFLFKHLLKEVALKHGLIVVCMAKPLAKTPRFDAHPPEHRRTGRWAKHLQRSRWRAFRRVPPLHRRPAGLPGGLHALLRAACELLPAPLPSLRFAEQRLLVPRQPRRRPTHPGQRSLRAARRESPAGRRRQPLPGHRRQPGRRSLRPGARTGAEPGDPG